jgi:cell division protein FtsL
MSAKNNIAPKAAHQQKAGFLWMIVICLIFCELLVHTWVRTESTQTILRVSAAQESYIQKTSHHKALSVERDRLKSDDRITQIAKTRLNLSIDTLNQTIYLSGEDS